MAQATPVITWAAPSSIPYGTALSATQLNATANVPGVFVYTPLAGAVLAVGSGQTLSVAFTPTDTTDYKNITATTSITVNAVPAAVVSVSGLTASGTYGAGALISLGVTFSKPVIVTGTPVLALNSGGTAIYSAGSGTSTLTFVYTVAAGQSSARLDASSVSALTLNGGAIVDSGALAANLLQPAPGAAGSLGMNANIVIDGVAPTVVSYQVLWGSESYNVIGTARNRLPWQITGIRVVFSKTIAGATVSSLTGLSASGVSGVGTPALTWTITPVAIGTFSTALSVTGAGAIKDAAGNALAAGAGFSQNLKVLYGDVNDDGVVNSQDLVLLNNATRQPYNILMDMDGDGAVTATDVKLVQPRVGTSLP